MYFLRNINTILIGIGMFVTIGNIEIILAWSVKLIDKPTHKVHDILDVILTQQFLFGMRMYQHAHVSTHSPLFY